MVQRLAGAMDVPLRDRNGLLVAAGYAPIYPHHDLDRPGARAGHGRADPSCCDQHEPYPAVVMDRRWDVVRVERRRGAAVRRPVRAGPGAGPGQRPAADARAGTGARRRAQLGRRRPGAARAGPHGRPSVG